MSDHKTSHPIRRKLILLLAVILLLGGLVAWLTGLIGNGVSCEFKSGIHCTDKNTGNQISTSPPPNQSSPVSPSVVTPIAPTGTKVSLSGEFVCLPVKDTGGPQTLECAMGLKAADGKFYALRDSTSDYSLISKAKTSDQVDITGVLEASVSSKYDIVGTVVLDSLTVANTP